MVGNSPRSGFKNAFLGNNESTYRQRGAMAFEYGVLIAVVCMLCLATIDNFSRATKANVKGIVLAMGGGSSSTIGGPDGQKGRIPVTTSHPGP